MKKKIIIPLVVLKENFEKVYERHCKEIGEYSAYEKYMKNLPPQLKEMQGIGIDAFSGLEEKLLYWAEYADNMFDMDKKHYKKWFKKTIHKFSIKHTKVYLRIFYIHMLKRLIKFLEWMIVDSEKHGMENNYKKEVK